jgi:hypothetical protein
MSVASFHPFNQFEVSIAHLHKLYRRRAENRTEKNRLRSKGYDHDLVERDYQPGRG